jgi:carbonic anhydrase/acetyltransferase-like protein (isoleucine patch superfamily)
MIYAIGDLEPSFLGDYYVANNAIVAGSVALHHNASIWFNAVVRGDNEPITIGENSNVQDGAVLHTDPGYPLTLGKNVTVGHMVMLHGCSVGDNTLIGIGALIMNGAVIGKNCIIGAKTLISERKVIPDGSLVVGSPGRIIRQLSEADIAANLHGAQHYVDNFKRYRAEFKPLAQPE